MSIVQRLEAAAKNRAHITVKLTEFLAQPIEGEVKLRPLFVAEINAAVESALKQRKSLLASLPESHARQFLDDPSFLEDVKVCEILWHACRDVDDVTKHAFPSSQWMREQMTNDELAALNCFYDRACQNDSSVKEPLTREDRIALTRGIAANADSDMPDRLLAKLPGIVVADLLVWLAREAVRAGAFAET